MLWLAAEHPELVPRYEAMYKFSAYAPKEYRKWLADQASGRWRESTGSCAARRIPRREPCARGRCGRPRSTTPSPRCSDRRPRLPRPATRPQHGVLDRSMQCDTAQRASLRVRSTRVAGPTPASWLAGGQSRLQPLRARHRLYLRLPARSSKSSATSPPPHRRPSGRCCSRWRVTARPAGDARSLAHDFLLGAVPGLRWHQPVLAVLRAAVRLPVDQRGSHAGDIAGGRCLSCSSAGRDSVRARRSSGERSVSPLARRRRSERHSRPRSTLRFDVIPIVVEVGLVLVEGTDAFTRSRRVAVRPELDRAVIDEELSVLRYSTEVKAAAIMHDTVLEPPCRRLRPAPKARSSRPCGIRCEKDLAVLVGEEWLNDPVPGLDDQSKLGLAQERAAVSRAGGPRPAA